MSTVLTMAALQSRSEYELNNPLRQAQYDLASSLSGAAERRAALATLDNITRVISQRRARPRPPGF